MEETSEHGILGRHQSCFEERIEVLSNTIERYHSSRNKTLPAYCIPKVVRMETQEVIYEKVYASRPPPPKISLKHDWMKELGSKVAQRPDGHVVQQFKRFQLNQANPNPDHDRTGQPVVGRESNHEPVHQANQKIPKTIKKETMIERGNPLFADSGPASSEILEWLQEIKENLVDDEVPERRDSHASSSHEASLEPILKRREDLGKHSVYTHFPKDRN